MFIPQPVVPPPSSRARRLADELSETIREYRRHHPELADHEVRQALSLSATRSRTSMEPRLLAAIFIAGLIGLLAVAINAYL